MALTAPYYFSPTLPFSSSPTRPIFLLFVPRGPKRYEARSPNVLRLAPTDHPTTGNEGVNMLLRNDHTAR